MEKKAKRIEIVNEIIREIASRGRRFFADKETGNVAYLFTRNNKIFYKCEWVSTRTYKAKTEICFSISGYSSPKGWYHGGTLLALVRDFKKYIDTGEYSNHDHGYGGLYCPHWGYSPEDMKAIQDKALELGYLKPSPTPEV